MFVDRDTSLPDQSDRRTQEKEKERENKVMKRRRGKRDNSEVDDFHHQHRPSIVGVILKDHTMKL